MKIKAKGEKKKAKGRSQDQACDSSIWAFELAQPPWRRKRLRWSDHLQQIIPSFISTWWWNTVQTRHWDQCSLLVGEFIRARWVTLPDWQRMGRSSALGSSLSSACMSLHLAGPDLYPLNNIDDKYKAFLSSLSHSSKLPNLKWP